MTAAIPTASPFDSIRQVRPDGSEFWSARDMQPLMGYSSWRNFSTPIQRAMATAGNQGHDIAVHFAGSRKVSPSGPDAVDFELSRFAAYLVAMNGDPNMPEVAGAQAYFAVKTREAEVAPAIDPEKITRAQLARMILESEEEKSVLAAALESAAPAIAYHDRYVLPDDVCTIKAWGAQHGLTEPQAFDLLRDRKVIYRASLGERWSASKGRREEVFEHRARAGKTFGFFDLRPQHNAPRHHNGQVRQTLYVRQGFALDLGAHLGLNRTAVAS